uniref:non-specific serine/threonine protein kinase n=1 Tax=Helianthus annuus TaxID=4232 RepID=A0A251S427_HELAN
MVAHPLLFLMEMLAIILILYSSFVFAKLDTQEGEVLKEILEKLGMGEWSFGKDPCSSRVNPKVRDGRMELNGFYGYIQGCSLEGPFPYSSISALTQLVDLRISDLKGGAYSKFPQLEKMTNLKKLLLRNCLIHGTIPEYIGNMKLEALDLSFNNFSGRIPQSFSQLRNAKYIYLTQNNLSGTIPEWVFTSTKDVDVSYNQFIWDASHPHMCAQGFVNMVQSHSSAINDGTNILPCLRKDFPCNKSNDQLAYSMFINCGGEEVYINNTLKYKEDLESKLTPYYDGGNWAFSSTGNFLDDSGDDVYIISNTSNLHNISTSDTKLFINARTAAISLTYYGLCLLNGNYNLTLYFAEIVFSQDKSYNSLGKRVFDVYVQGELKIKDFDIVKEAGGTGRAVLKKYTVNVQKNTLKIQLYWAGKGTTCIPKRGSYGPIISAISVEPNFKPPNFGKKTKVGLIAGTIGGVLFFVVLIISILWRKGYIMGGKTADSELRASDLEKKNIFTYKQIQAATKNFDPLNKLGKGGFGSVFKGVLLDGTIIAVKQLSDVSKQGAREFVNEIGILSAARHPNLIRIYGCCAEGSQLLLIYEYMENNSLSHALLGNEKRLKAKLTWPVRFKICLGIARGLRHKASNVLLDEDFNAKISDFGLAKLHDDQNTHVTTRVVGTMFYMAPEYATRGYLTPKADVYGFGIVALKIVSGISVYTELMSDVKGYCIIDKALMLKGRDLLKMVDKDLGSDYSSEEALTVLNVVVLCLEVSAIRPTMSQTCNMLEGKLNINDFRSSMRPPLDQRIDISLLWPDYKRNDMETGASTSTQSVFTDSFLTEDFITKDFIAEVPTFFS